MTKVFPQRAPSGPWRAVTVVALTALIVAIAAVLAFTVVGAADRASPEPGAPSVSGQPAPASPGATDLAAKEELTLDGAKEVYNLHQAAKGSRDVAAFTKATCKQFIDADIALRRLTDTADLLEAYEQAEKFVQVQTIENQEVIGASGHAPSPGTVRVSAKVTDNRQVPPNPQQRTLTYEMVWEEGRWKLCPTTDPV